MTAHLPSVGRWIKWTSGDHEFKCEILDYEDLEGFESSFLFSNTFQATLEKSAHVRYTDGSEDSLDEMSLKMYGWTYCDAPAEHELEQAKYEQLNRDFGRSCARCGCFKKKLQFCTGCHEQYYCNATCQRAHWASHKDTCRHQKIELKPNPRYPLTQISNEVKERQMKIQTDHNELLQDALSGNFTVQTPDQYSSNTLPVRNPKSGSDMESGERYKVIINNKDFEFKWKGLESTEHSIPKNRPTACTTFLHMEMTLGGNEHIRGGLNNLAGSGDETFWYMLINFNTFGTVAPFHGPCFCNPNNVKGEMAPERRKLKEKWDRIFKRAKADVKDVQCMFSDTQEGCHNYKDCPYKHDVENEEKVEFEEKEEKEEETKDKKNNNIEEVLLSPEVPKGIKPGPDAANGAHQLNSTEKVLHAKIFKEEGTEHFKNNEFEKAAAKYKKVVDFLSIDEDEYYGIEKEERKDLLRACQLNLALCYIKLGKWTEAKETCTKVIETKGGNIVKAWFRRGEANFGLKDFENAKSDFERARKLEPTNTATKNKLVLCQHAIKEEREQEKKMVSNVFERMNKKEERDKFSVKENSIITELEAMKAKFAHLKSQKAKFAHLKSQNHKESVLFVEVEGYQLVDWMAGFLLGETVSKRIGSKNMASSAQKAWQGLKIDRCAKIPDCIRKISSGRYKAIVIVDLCDNHARFEEELGRVLQIFVQAGGSVAFPTCDGLSLAGTLSTLFNTSWQKSGYYRSMWDVSRENSDTVAEFFGDLSQLQDLPFSAKVASVKSVPRHEQCFRIMPGAKSQSLVPFVPGGEVGADDVCVAVHKYGSGSIAFFGDHNCETVTVQLVAAYIRTRLEGSINH